MSNGYIKNKNIENDIITNKPELRKEIFFTILN